jgi:hypothetical protein
MVSVFTLEGLSPQQLSLLGTPTDTSFWNTGENYQTLNTVAKPPANVRRMENYQPSGLPQAMANQPSLGNPPIQYFNMNDTGPLQRALDNRLHLGDTPIIEYGVRARANARMLGDAAVQPSNVPANPNTVYYPINYGGPYAPHGKVIGPQRPFTYVYGAGGTPTSYGWTPPPRGAITDYANPTPNFVSFSGPQQLGHYGHGYRYEDSDCSPNWVVAGVGMALGAAVVWLLGKR